MDQNCFARAAQLVAAQLPEGVFLCVGGETPNVMTVGWGGLTWMWSLPVFAAPVRPQRATYPLLRKTGAYTLCVPKPGEMRRALALAGSLSGRDGDKFAALGITPEASRLIDAPVIPGCALTLECRVVAESELTPIRFDPTLGRKVYPAQDYHTFFYGEVLALRFGEEE